MHKKHFLQLMILSMFTIIFLISCSQAEDAAIKGKLLDSGEPIRNASITLKMHPDANDLEKTREYKSTRSDSEGGFVFKEIPTGFYSIEIEWDIDQRPNESMFFRGDFLIYFLLTKDYKHKAYALSDVFEFDGKKDKVLDLNY